MHFERFLAAVFCVCLIPFGYAAQNNEIEPVLTKPEPLIQDNESPSVSVTKEPIKQDTEGDENNKAQVTRQPKKAPKHHLLTKSRKNLKDWPQNQEKNH